MAEKEKGKKKKRKNRHEDEDRPRKRHATELDINQTVKFTFRDDPGPLGPAIGMPQPAYSLDDLC